MKSSRHVNFAILRFAYFATLTFDLGVAFHVSNRIRKRGKHDVPKVVCFSPDGKFVMKMGGHG